MQITLNQNEIEGAIRDHVHGQVNIRESQELSIDLRAGRGEKGFTATIEIKPRTVADNGPVEGVSDDAPHLVKAMPAVDPTPTEIAKPEPEAEPAPLTVAETEAAPAKATRAPRKNSKAAKAAAAAAEAEAADEAGKTEDGLTSGGSLCAGVPLIITK